MREVGLSAGLPVTEARTLRACIATILELPLDAVPESGDGDPANDWGLRRWLGGLGLGLVPVADGATFSWAGPWIAWARDAEGGRRAVVMFGVPAGAVWDPATSAPPDPELPVEDGYVIAALDIALARPALAPGSHQAGEVVSIHVAPEAGASGAELGRVRAIPGRGLEGDRHTVGKGTFPSGQPGSALTLIEAEVCESFDPPLRADEHRRNVVTRGVDLNALVGHEFRLGEVRCKGMRLCEPCTVVERYASRPVLRALVHRGGLRADILSDGEIAVGDEIASAKESPSGGR
ncbi:MAG TPA: MOSC domain-containing protein [Solirubrobacterales bacterium]|nr:MOSC domain-containing protein [Solirubrobacterales bacterium]